MFFILAFGVFLFALPKLIIGDYKPCGIGQSLPICTRNGTAGNDCVETQDTQSLLHVTLFFFSQFIIGAGTTPLQTLGKDKVFQRYRRS